MADRGLLPRSIRIAEMGPRDGLQNEATILPTAVKVEFIDRLSRTGLNYIEATSFVSKAWVPQMGDASEVMTGIQRVPGITYSVLVPNAKGMEGAVAAKCEEIAVFAAATDAFSRRNINCSVLDSLERFKPVMAAAKAAGMRVRGYVSCALGCPYEGAVAPDAVGFVAASLLELGCYEISLGDTIGVGTPASVRALLASVAQHVPLPAVAVHFHDTYGCAVANVATALEMGVTVVDASVAGLGGCPYAKGASGNVSTEDVVYLCQGLGVDTGVDLDALVETSDWISHQLGAASAAAAAAAAGKEPPATVVPRPNRSKVATARLAHGKALRAAETALREAEEQERRRAAQRAAEEAAAGAGAGGGAAGSAGGPACVSTNAAGVAAASKAAAGGASAASSGAGKAPVDPVAASRSKAQASISAARIGLSWPARDTSSLGGAAGAPASHA